MSTRSVKGEVVAGRVGENGPPADIGNHGFTAMRLDYRKSGVDIIGSEIDQQAVALVLDRSLSRRLDKTSARAALGLELYIVVRLVSLDLPAKNIAVELPRCAGIRGGDLDMHDWMA